MSDKAVAKIGPEARTQAKPPLNIYQRINEVRKVAGYLKKDKSVETGGKPYKAATHDAVTALLRNHLIDQGVLIVPRLMQSAVENIGLTKGGSPVIRYSARYEVDFVNCDDPSDKIIVPSEAHANDSGDKAPGKAVSYATKYAMLKLFSIETGEDDEGRVEPYGGRETISEQQVAELEALITEVGADKAKFLEWGKIKSLDQIHVNAYKLCVEMLLRKRK